MLVGRSNLSMLLPEPERRRLVNRVPDSDDRRVRRLSLTAEGGMLTLRAPKVQVQVIETMMAAFSAEECEASGDHMRRVGHHMLANPLSADTLSGRNKRWPPGGRPSSCASAPRRYRAGFSCGASPRVFQSE